jgi:hypothetical protein
MNPVRFTLTIIFIFFLLQGYLPAQIIRDGVTFYGNEWINYDQQYARIRVGEDGIYRLTYQQMAAAGLPVDQIDAGTYRLYWLGTEQRLYTSKATGSLTESDYLEFYGEKNRSQVDRYLFSDPDRQMLNPEYGLTTDTSTYFLTWTPGIPSQNRFDVVENSLTGQLPPRKTWYLHRKQEIMSDQHFKGALNSDGVRLSTYGEGEGFASPARNNHTFELTTSAIAAEGPEPQLHIRMTGNLQPHQVSIRWNGQELLQFNFVGNNEQGGSVVVDSVVTLSRADLRASNNLVATTTGNTRFAIAGISYPRTFRFEGQDEVLLEVDDTREGVYLELEDFGHSGQRPLVYDLSGGFTLEGTIEGNLTRINLPSGPRNRKILIVSAVKNKRQPPVTVTTFDDLRQSDANYILVSHRDLFDDGQGQNQVAEYARYRQTAQGGQYRTRIIDIQQLIDQFAYGVARHPLSIKNFVNYIHEHWQGPEFIFLVGKGLEYSQSRKSQETYDYLPVYGIPGSDNLLTSQGASSVPLIPVGRLAARTPEQIAIYLEKIQVMEDQIANAPQTIEDRGWMKRVLHLSGGVGASEQRFIEGRMNDMAKIPEDGSFAGQVSLVSSVSSEIIEGLTTESTYRLINEGIILKSYFGHGSTSTTQYQGYEDPFFLDNKGKYPVMLALGCFTGNLFVKEVSLGESNVFAQNRGAVAYLATSGLGSLNALDQFAIDWYKRLFNVNNQLPIGSVTQETLDNFKGNVSDGIRTLLQQFTIHGDPTFQIFLPQSPDYTIDHTSISLTPEQITSDLDSFEIKLDIINLGLRRSDSLFISIEHTLPSSTQAKYNNIQLIYPEGYRTKTKLKIPLGETREIGNHLFDFILDENNQVDENPKPAAEQNNRFSFNGSTLQIFFSAAAVLPMLPQEYGILNTENINLMAFNSSSENNNKSFRLEIDTTRSFQSPFLYGETISTSQRIISWQPQVPLIANTVYYWRVRSEGGGNTSWRHSSFTYLPGSPDGWNNGHFQQLTDNQFFQLSMDSISRNLVFGNTYTDFILKNKVFDQNDQPRGLINGSHWVDFFSWEFDQGITLVVSDPSNRWGLEFNTRPGLYGSILNKYARIAAFPFSVETAEDRRKIIDFINNVIEEGRMILFYTIQRSPLHDLQISEWQADSILFDGKNIFNVLESHGAKNIRQLISNPRPYAITFIKGSHVISEDLAIDISDAATMNLFLPTLASSGFLESKMIGPSINWLTLDINTSLSSEDSVTVELYGISTSGVPTFLFETTELAIALSDIDPTLFPYLKFRVNFNSNDPFNPPKITYLKVLFDKPPEFVPDFSDNLPFLSFFGLDKAVVNYTIHNVGPVSGDSLKIHTITGTSPDAIATSWYPPLAPNQSIRISDTITIPPPKGNVTLEVNPDFDQPEQHNFNNFISAHYDFNRDLINPLLHVTFDGKQIMQNDIVSPSPEIIITLKDENSNLLLNNPGLFDVYTVSPNGERVRYSVDNQNIVFLPAESSENVAKMILNPIFNEEGIYNLNVQARDVKGNKSGSLDYKIDFEIILQSAISRIVNYPNPFSNSTRFAYVLTGNKIPDDYLIRIFTPSGKVVRELTQSDLGPLSIGRNLTTGAWDGSDEFGDRLANGTYFFIFKIQDSSNFEHFSSEIDKYFEKNLGKIVILR